MKNQIKIYLLT